MTGPDISSSIARRSAARDAPTVVSPASKNDAQRLGCEVDSHRGGDALQAVHGRKLPTPTEVHEDRARLRDGEVPEEGFTARDGQREGEDCLGLEGPPLACERAVGASRPHALHQPPHRRDELCEARRVGAEVEQEHRAAR